MSINGQWVNQFGSVMRLEQQHSGSVFGIYSSTTGSSGSYYVTGWTDPSPPADGMGQSLALSILWRSFAGGKGDPSWHYVSGFSGQLITLNATPNLVLIHDLVATTPFPKVVPEVGSYLDKLIYSPYQGHATESPEWPPQFTKPAFTDPVDGVWTCREDHHLRLSLALQDKRTGYVVGTLATPAGAAQLSGFTDNRAADESLMLQGVSLTALLPGVSNTVIALAGTLDLKTNGLSLAWLQSNGTSSDLVWTQTHFRCLTFSKA